MGVTQHTMGSDTSTAISNLLLVTGNYMRPGTGAIRCAGTTTCRARATIGRCRTSFPGYQSVDDPEIRSKFEKAWKVQLPTKPGLDNHQMIEAIHEGKLKAMYLFGEEISMVDSNANYVGDALRKLEFLCSAGYFLQRDVPICRRNSAGEPEPGKGRNVYQHREANSAACTRYFEPLGESKPDWKIIRKLRTGSERIGTTNRQPNHYEEIAPLTPIMAGVTYERLKGYKTLQWPVALDGSDQPLLYTKEFALPDGKAKLFPLEWTEPSNQPDAEFDLHLNNGRMLEHFHEGNMTYRSEGIKANVPSSFVEVSPELARDRGIEDGSLIELSSKYGTVRVKALVTERVKGKELYMPMNSVTEPVNRLTSSYTDKATHTPAYKETAVRMKVIEIQGESPLPRSNSRFGHPTAQSGVEVERKWKRADYRIPGNGLVQIERK